jgi:hypothetical protein
MDRLEYYLRRPAFLSKTPTLILSFKPKRHFTRTTHEELESAVLLYEHRFCGVGCRLFTADYQGGARAVIAPVASRSRVAFDANAALLRRGALLVHVSFESGQVPIETAAAGWPAKRPRARWTATERLSVTYLPVEETVDATLATLGKTTRRNLRYYRKRAEASLHPAAIDHPDLTAEEFVAFNRNCAYPASDEEAADRLAEIRRMPSDHLFLGLKAASGEWLSFIGGCSYKGRTDVQWQMNRADMPSFSLSTVMRSHLIEHEVGRGTRKIYFIGGTPHSMRNTMVSNKIVDVVVARYGVPTWMIRPLARSHPERSSFVVQMLSNSALQWRAW